MKFKQSNHLIQEKGQINTEFLILDHCFINLKGKAIKVRRK